MPFPTHPGVLLVQRRPCGDGGAMMGPPLAATSNLWHATKWEVGRGLPALAWYTAVVFVYMAAMGQVVWAGVTSGLPKPSRHGELALGLPSGHGYWAPAPLCLWLPAASAPLCGTRAG